MLNAPPADKIVLQSPAALRPGDFGLDTILTNLPQNATVAGIPLPITINAVRLDLLGQVGSPPQGFLRNPTSCGTNTFSVDVDPLRRRARQRVRLLRHRQLRGGSVLARVQRRPRAVGRDDRRRRGLDDDLADDRGGGAEAGDRDAAAPS